MRIKPYLVLGFALLLLTVFTLPAGAAPPTKEQARPPADQNQQTEEVQYTKQIFVVIIDGLQSGALQRTQAPNLNGVAAAGIKMSESLPVWPENVYTSTASILTGADPDAHGFSEPTSSLQKPTIIQLAEQSRIQTAVFDGTGELEALAEGTRHYQKANSDEKLIDQVIKDLSDHHWYLNVVVLAEPREALDRWGAESQQYLRAVTEADNHFGRLLHHLHTKGVFDQTMFFVTGTTGQPPIIIKGMQFKSGQVLPPASLMDVAPTLAYTLGLNISGGTGLVIWNAFDPGSLQNGFYLLEQRIKELSELQARYGQEIFRLKEEQVMVQEEKHRISAEKSRTSEAMEQRDEEIRALRNRIGLLKTIIGGILLLAAVGYVIEYRYLRKRFLMF